MSTYAVNKVCWLVERDPAFRERLRRDPDAVLAEFKLDPDEARALKTGDVVTLFRRGAHAFLLQNLGRYGLAGLDRQTYRRLITSLVD